MRKLYLILLTIAFISLRFASAQTYLSQNFEAEFTPNTSAGPNAPNTWSQTRLGTLTAAPGTPGTSGQRDWARSAWTGTAWSSNTAPNVNRAAYSSTAPAGTPNGTGVAWFNDGYCAGSGTAGQNIRRLQSPVIDLSGSTVPMVTFYYNYYSGSASMSLVASNDGGLTWTTINTYGNLSSSVAWSSNNVALPAAYKVSNAMIGFQVSNSWGSYDLFLDSIMVREPVTPASPITFTATPVSFSSMTINWVDNSTNELAFRLYRSTDNITFTKIGSDILSTSSSSTGTGYSMVQGLLSPNTTYYYRIVSLSDLESSYLTGNQATTSCPSSGLSGTKTVGPTGDFSTLTAALASVSSGISGAVVLELQSTYTSTSETFPISFKYSGCMNSSQTITVRPASGATALSITSSNATATLSIDSGRYFIIDGRPGGVGTASQLTISNTATGTAVAVKFVNDASSNTIKYCNVLGSTSTSFGVIYFGTGLSTGNDGNTISNNNIGAAGSNFPLNGIYSMGTSATIDNSGNIITGNNIYDYFNATASCSGVNLNSFNAGWTVSNNRFYQTATRLFTAAATHYGLVITSGDGYTITGNILGYANASGTGTTNIVGNTVSLTGTFPSSYTTTGTPNATRYVAISASFLAGGLVSSIQGNTIAGFALYTSSGATTTYGILCGIQVTSGNVNIGTTTGNTIGSTTGNGSIYTACTTSGGVVVGIYVTSSNTVNIQNNTVGAIDAMGTTATIGGSVTGINNAGTGSYTISNNFIGNSTNPNLRMGNLNTGTNLSNTGTTFGVVSGAALFQGILSSASGTVTINANSIANAYVNTTSTLTTASFRGIYISSGTYTVSNNAINNLTSMSANAAVSSGLIAGIGIYVSGGVVGSNVTSNTINSLNLANTTTSGTILAAISVANFAVEITKNIIFDLINASTSVTTTTPGVACGIFIRSATAATNMNIINNMISLGAGQTGNITFAGIIGNHGSIPDPIVNIYYNTINIEGLVTTGAQPTYGIGRTDFSTIAKTVTYNIKNNIITNTRSGGTGKHYAIANNYGVVTSSATGWGAGASNNNVLNANSATIGYWSGDKTFADWKTASACDVLSLSGVTVNYANSMTGDLHLSMSTTPTQLESGGTPIAGYTTDFDNQNRPGPTGSVNGAGFAPDFGADEFDGVFLDINSPIITPSSLSNTLCTASRAVTAAIIDLSAVNSTTTNKPRVYFKKATNVNGLPSTNDNTTDGWKYVQTTSSTSPYSFNINTSLIFGGLSGGDTLQYFIVAQDLAPTPNVGISNGAFATKPSSVVLTSTAFPIATPISYYAIPATSLSGNITIGATGTYTSITGANGLFAAINSTGLSGNLNVSILDAAVAEDGSNALNPVTYGCTGTYSISIKPFSGVTTVLSGSSAGAIIKLNGARFVTIDGANSNGGSTQNLTITNTNTSTTSAVVWLASTAAGDSASNNVVKNCIIKGNASTTTFGGIICSGSTIGGSAEKGNSSNVFQNNAISLAQYGVAIAGASTVQNSNSIINNSIGNATEAIGFRGIFISNENGTIISGNTIQNIVTSISAAAGIYLGGVSTGILISRNTIKNIASTSTASGTSSITSILQGTANINTTIDGNVITGINSTNTSGYGVRGMIIQSSGTVVSNNMLSDISNYQDALVASYGTLGITVDGAVTGVKIYNNSVNLFGSHAGYSSNLTAGASACMYVNVSTTGGVDIRNNVFSNTYNNSTSTGDKTYAIYSVTPITALLNVDNNAYYVGGTATPVLGYLTADVSTLAALQTAFGNNLSSVVAAPVYISNTDLHLSNANGSNWCLNNKGVSISGITADIDAQTRSLTTPDLGADEFTAIGDATATPSIQTICNGNSITTIAFSGVAASYNWTRDNTAAVTGISASGTGDISGTLTNSTTASVTVTFTVSPIILGCAGPGITASVIVNPTPVATASVTSQTICNGGAIAAINLSGVVSGTTYSWTRDNTDSITGIAASGTGNITGTLTSSAKSDKAVTFTITPNANGCSGAPIYVTVNVNLIPAIIATAPAARCDAGILTLGATSDFGSISWFAAASGGSALNTGNTFTTPSLTVTTIYYVQVATATCISARTAITATVNTTPTITSTTPGSRCDTGPINLAATASAGTINWYNVATGGTSLGTGNSFITPSVSVSTTYYIDATSNSCTTPTRTPIVAAISASLSINGTPAARCDAGTVTLSAAASGGVLSWFTVASGGTAIATGASFTTPILNTTTTYYVEANSGTCSSVRIPVVATINITPTVTSTTPGARCDAGTVVLGATASAGTLNWYDLATGGTLLGTGNSFTTPSITATTTYYVEAIFAGCTMARTPVLATVYATPSVATTTPGSRCDLGAVTLSATASAGTISWFAAATGGTALATGNVFVTPSLTTTTTYYVAATNNNCTSLRTAVVATINATPTITSTTPGSRCDAGTVVLGATSSVGVVNWYLLPFGGTLLGTGTSFITPSITTTTTYYAEANNGGCISSRSAVVATVNATPTIAAPAVSRCDAGIVTLNATSNTGTISWFSVATGGTAIATGNSFTTPSLTASTTYYVQAATTTCTSARIAVNAVVNVTPSILTTTPFGRCGAGVVNLNATTSGGVVYWYAYPTGGAILATGNTYSPTISATTTFYAEANNNGCALSRVAVTATINPLPTAIVAGPSSVCVNGINTYTLGNISTSIGGYTWVVVGGTITTGQSTPGITVTWGAAGAGSVTCNLLSALGCTGATPVFNVTKNSNPTAGFIGTTTVCPGIPYTYTATSVGNTYTWIPTNGAVVTQSGSNATIVWNNAASASLMLTEISGTGCFASTSQAITITGPLVSSITGATQVCNNSTQTYTLNGTTTSLWTVTGGTITTSTATAVTVNWTSTGAQSISAAYTNGTCSYNVSLTVNVNALPTPAIIGSNQACTGTTYTYSTVYNGGRTYNWNVSSNGSVISGQGTNAITVLWNTAGGGLITVNEAVTATGCNATSGALILNVVALPTSAISGLTIGCSGVPTVYTGAPAANYAWSISGGTINGASNGSSVNVTWGTGTNGTLTLTSSNGICITTNTLPVNINITPTPVITGPSYLCSGSSSTFSTGFNNTYNYNWSVINGTFTYGGNNNIINVTPNVGATAVNVTLIVNVTGSTCNGTANKALPVNTTPTVVISGNNVACQGSSQTYTATGASTYVFNVSGGTITSSTSNTVTVTWGYYNGSISVQGTSAAGCSANAIMPVTINALPTATVIGASQVCANAVNVYNVSAQSGHTYVWTVTGGTINGSATGNAISVTWGSAGTGTVKVTATNASACSDSRTMNITINAQPTPSITGTATVCQNTNQTYSISAIAGAAYNWIVKGGNVISGAGTNTVNVNWNTVGAGSIIVAQSNGACMGNTNITVNVNAAPAIPMVFRAGNVLSTNAIATSYQWNNGATPISGATSATYTALTAGNYSLTVKNAAGCSTTSSVVIANVGIKNSAALNNVMVYPNPAHDMVTVSAQLKKLQDVTIRMYDINGKLVFTTFINNADVNFARTISLEGLASGVYVVQILTDEGLVQQRVVKE